MNKRALIHYAIALLALLGGSAAAEQVFVYREIDGTRWFTNFRMPEAQFTLIETIGRPTATASCGGVTQAVMEQRAGDYAATIEEYAKLYGVDRLLIKAIISAESCFDKYAVSRVGAKGLMQLMPGTAEFLGVANVFDPTDNMRGGIRYFSLMLKRFEQNTELALAAYNAGPKAVEKYKGIPPYAETQKYVERVLRYYNRYSGRAELN